MKKYFVKFLVLLFFSVGMLQTTQYSIMAATMGQSLTSPEDGCRRYDNKNPLMLYEGNWYLSDSIISGRWENSVSSSRSKGDTLTFKFYGSKLRIIAEDFSTHSSFEISIDGGAKEDIDISRSTGNNRIVQCFSYEKSNLNLGVHTVTLTNKGNNTNEAVLDAIDIDEDGYLIPLDTLKVVMEVNEEQQLSIDHDLSENLQAVWTSSNPAVASVDSNGVVKALSIGNTTIKVTYPDGTTEYIRVLVVENASDYRLAVDLKIGKTCRLTIDDYTFTMPVTWTVMDPTVATISARGKVTAVGVGLTFVTAYDGEGNEVGQIYIRVRE